MKKILPRLLIVLAVLAAAALAYVYLVLPRTSAQPAGGQTPAPITYQTAQVRKSELSDSISTTGAVRSSQTALLVWQTSGTVGPVNVVKGQVVAAKTILAELEQTSLPQSVILAQADLVTAQKNLDTLIQSTQARANTQLALVKAQQTLDDANKDRRNKLYQRASQETIDIARARLITANDALDKAQTFFDGHSGDTKSVTYANALDMLAKARQNQTLAQYNLNYVEGLPDPLDIEEADAKIAVAEANVLQAKLDWDRVKDGPNEQDVAAAEARVAAAQATLNLAHIAAPFAGTLTQVVSKTGDQVNPSTLAFQLDDLSHLYVDVTVSEDDIQNVKVGQPVTLSFDALPGKDYKGAVTEIAAFGKATAGTVNFTVTAEVSQPGDEIKPGMTASADIVLGQPRSTLFVPTRAIRTQENQRVVYLLKDGAAVPVAIATGEASGADTAITAGAIKEGDRVILNPELP